MKSYLRFYVKTIEIIIGSVDREIKLLMRYFEGKVCIAYRGYYKRGF